MVYGTPFEQLEDEDKTAITKRPKGIQDEIVTDERGKRRFHGAFTGGFSAGYFNSVGTKHGWVPQTFKSSREDRADKQGQVAEDFMDDEDLGEFGIAAKKLRTRVDFMDSLAGPGEKRLLAWERSATTSSAAAAEEETSLAHRLTGMLRPVNDSVGVRILKKMGWRPGKGIGAKMTRRALERQKVLDAKSFGKRTEFDEQTVQEVEQHVPGTEFSPDDISIFEIRSKEDVHGLGYRPLQESGVLSEKYGVKVSTLKTTKKSKGIRGQAFGVGAFEEEDEDIYMDYDLSQYDFEVGASSSKTAHDVPKFDSTFVPASASAGPSRKYFLAPTVPSGWRPNPGRIKTLLEKRAPPKLSESVAKACEQLTPFQRAKLLGERDHSVMEMLSSADRERLRQLGGKGRDKENASSARRPHEQDNRGGGGGRGGRRANEAEPFEEEPMKAHRFRQYVAYLKRGIPFPQPVDMTRLEWEKEQEQFQDALPPELRALLPEVRDRQKPLAKIDFAKPIAEHLKSRFARESGTEIKYEPATTSADPKVEAVRNKQFGQATRQKHVWHPAKELCKRFNVPNPFPDSQIIGTPGLSKMSQRNYEAEYSLFDVGGGLRDTASEVASRRHPSRFDQHAGGPAAAGKEQQQKDIKQEPPVEGGNEDKKDGLAPMSLLSAIFGEDDKDGEEAEEQQEDAEEQPDEEEEEVEDEALIRIPTRKQQPEVPKESAAATASNSNQYITAAANAKRVVTVFDVLEDEEDVYGPAMPPQEFLAQEFKVEEQIKISETTEMITIESDDDGSSNSSEKNGGADEDRRRRRSKKKSKKEKKHSKKSKKAKKEKRKHRNASGSD